jgi:hypothetical protein
MPEVALLERRKASVAIPYFRLYFDLAAVDLQQGCLPARSVSGHSRDPLALAAEWGQRRIAASQGLAIKDNGQQCPFKQTYVQYGSIIPPASTAVNSVPTRS